MIPLQIQQYVRNVYQNFFNKTMFVIKEQIQVLNFVSKLILKMIIVKSVIKIPYYQQMV